MIFKVLGQRTRSPDQIVTAQHPCEHSIINILQWILTNLGTCLILRRVWNPIDFNVICQRSRSQGQMFRRGDTPRFALPLLYFFCSTTRGLYNDQDAQGSRLMGLCISISSFVERKYKLIRINSLIAYYTKSLPMCIDNMIKAMFICQNNLLKCQKNMWIKHEQEKFEDTKRLIRSRKSKKDRQRNSHKKTGQKDKQWSTKHYIEKWRSINTNPTKTGVEFRCSGRVAVPAPLVAHVCDSCY